MIPPLCSLSLLKDLGHHPRTDGPSPFTYGKPQSLFHGHRRNELNFHGHVVSGHHHLSTFRQLGHACNIGGANVELGTVSIKKWGVPATFLLGEDVGLCIEFRVRGDTPRFG